VDATATSLEHIRRDVACLDSNQETQKKQMVKELIQVEGVAQDSLDRSKGLQDQVDSVRQQTQVMTKSMTLMHKHSEELILSLKEIVHGICDLTFNMLGHFDDWLKIHLGQAGTGTSTVSGEDLQRQWNINLRIPSTPPLILDNNFVANAPQQFIPTSNPITEGA